MPISPLRLLELTFHSTPKYVVLFIISSIPTQKIPKCLITYALRLLTHDLLINDLCSTSTITRFASNTTTGSEISLLSAVEPICLDKWVGKTTFMGRSTYSSKIRPSIHVSSGTNAVDCQLHEGSDPWLWTSCLFEEAASH
jgi:hypothetical protein